MKGPDEQAEVRLHRDGHWEWIFTTFEPPYEVTGKYLFFSADRDLLVRIAHEELESGAFHQAKIPLVGKNLSADYVLCLYYHDDSRNHDLAGKYRGRKGLRFRYWKSDAATLRGVYSEKFVAQLQDALQKKLNGR